MKTTLFLRSVEPLESRIAPATLLALNDSDQLLRFNSATPGTIAATVAIGGLGGAEDVVGIDVRPATGVLYGLGLDGSTARLLTIDPVTGATAQVGATFTVSGTSFGFDFNPTLDRLRVVSDADENFSINPADGVVTTQTALNPDTPNVVGAAYTNSYPGATSTTLYAIDSGTDLLATITPPADGTLATVGALAVDTSDVVGFDIGHGKNEAFAALRVGGASRLYSINLASGGATDLGAIGTGTPNIRGLAVLMHVWDGGDVSSTSPTSANNWVTGIAPVAGDSLLFPDGPTRKIVSVSGTTAVFDTLRFTGSGYDYNGGPAKLNGGIAAHAIGTVKLSNIDLNGGSAGVDRIVAEQAGTKLEFTTVNLQAFGGRGARFEGAGTIEVTSLTTSGSTVQTVVDGPNLITSGYTGSVATRLVSGSITVMPSAFDSGSNTDFTDVVLQGGTLRAQFDPAGKNVVPTIVSGAITATGGTLESGVASFDMDGDLSLNSATTAAFNQPIDIGMQPLIVNGTVSLGDAMLAVNFAGAVPARLTLIENDGTDAVMGTFNGLAENATVNFGGQNYSITYAGGDGNDVVLTRVGTAAPDTIAGGMATFRDVDGDDVTVKVSKGTLALGNFIMRPQGLGAQLELLDLSNDDAFAGANITITAKRSAMGGDDSVNVGFIDATDLDLGTVSVPGDLGGLDAGDPATVGGVKALTVQSLGVLGLTTGAPDLRSDIDGPLGKLTVRGDVQHANVRVFDSDFASPEDYDGRIGTVLISGSLRGGDVQKTGLIESGRDIKTVKILGDLHGGGGAGSGVIETGALGSATVMGSIIGGANNFAGTIFAFDGAKSIKVGNDIIGGAGGDSGQVEVQDGLGSLIVGGSLIGGTGFNAGEIDIMGPLGSLKMGGSVVGGPGLESAHITVEGVKSISIKGSVTGMGMDSALIEIDGGAGAIFIGGSVTGGADRSARFELGDGFGDDSFGSLKIAGSFVGGASSSGLIRVTGDLKSLAVGREWQGGAGSFSGYFTGDNVGSVKIGGGIAGGGGSDSGRLDLDAVGKVSIGGDMAGGAGSRSGYIRADSVKSMTVSDSIITGTGAASGRIEVEGDLGALTVGVDIRGTAAVPMVLMMGAVSTPEKGADLVLGKLTVKGTVEHTRILAGFGGAAFSNTVTAKNADAQIGSVKVGIDWIASSISAGVQDDATATLDAFFGEADDRKIQGAGVTDTAEIISKIANITIKGQALGTVGGSDHFGFVAQEIGALTVGAVKFSLTKTLPAGNPDDPDANDPLLLIGPTGDLRVHEVAL